MFNPFKWFTKWSKQMSELTDAVNNLATAVNAATAKIAELGQPNPEVAAAVQSINQASAQLVAAVNPPAP